MSMPLSYRHGIVGELCLFHLLCGTGRMPAMAADGCSKLDINSLHAIHCCMQLTIGISLSPTMNLILLLILFFFHDTRLHNINIILTPHSLHYCTRMSRLFLNPASSDANKEVSHAKRRPGMMSLPHFTLQLSSLSIKG